ncbi:ubiquitin-related domain-containing protein [Circinella umbellata]|nr:ubiquitin-related domain-containing protein [Circinella umbellata]
MSSRDASIQEFVTTTGSSTEQAQFFLEMAGWDLKVAISQFYEFGEGIGAGAGTSTGGDNSTGEQTLGGNPIQASAAPSAGISSSSSKVRTLSDLGGGNNDDESDDDQHQNFFAGGEKSGMVVKGPNKHNDLVNQILKKAAEGGPAPEEEAGSSSDVPKPTYFKGSGYKLGSEEEPSSVVNPTLSTGEEEDDSLEPVTRYLTFWRDGFSVDDGQLYRYDDPANQTMLTAINSGRAPLSLLNVRHGQPVDVRVSRRQDEDYVPPPKAPPKPFEGSGHRLGSPAVSGEQSSTPGAFPGSSSSSSAAAATSNEPPVTLDESQPTTSVQIRLGDGSRLVAKFNHTHTVNDIRRYIDATRPTDRAYLLQTTFPVKELTDLDKTLKEAGLLNSVVVQRYQ